eukprot:259916-Ditylum_brightwellii.AAC.1
MSTLCGKFIPVQAWLLTSPETYRNLLHNQNKYINNVTSITIEGLYPEVANKEIKVSQENVSIKDNADAGAEFLDKELHQLYQCIVPNDLWFNQVPIPRQSETKRAQAVGSYKNVLIGWANPQEEMEPNFNLTKNALHSRKRAAIALNTDDESASPTNT